MSLSGLPPPWKRAQWVTSLVKPPSEFRNIPSASGELRNDSLVSEESSPHTAAEPLPPWHFPQRQPVVVQLSTHSKRKGGKWPITSFLHSPVHTTDTFFLAKLFLGLVVL